MTKPEESMSMEDHIELIKGIMATSLGIDLKAIQVKMTKEQDTLIARLLIEGLMQNKGEVRIPASWVEHLKSQLFPRWIKKLWPVKTIAVPAAPRFCPHISTPEWRGDRIVHMSWLQGRDSVE